MGAIPTVADLRSTTGRVYLLGAAAVLLLWIVAAVYIAPRMERYLQQQAVTLLTPLSYPIEVVTDGLQVEIKGSVPGSDEHFQVHRQLFAMHPLAQIRNLLIVEPVAKERVLPNELDPKLLDPQLLESKLAEVLNGAIDKIDDAQDIEASVCADYKLLDPQFDCSIGTESIDRTLDY